MGGLSKKYLAGRARGYEIAIRCMNKFGGIEGLRKEIRFRDYTGILTDACVFDLDVACEEIKRLSAETHGLMLIYAMHDEFDHGPVRTQRTLDTWKEEADKLIRRGIMEWGDYIEDVKKKYDLDISFFTDTRMKTVNDYDEGRERGIRQVLEAAERGEDINALITHRSMQRASQSFLRKEVDAVCLKIKVFALHVFTYLEMKLCKTVWKFGESRMNRLTKMIDFKGDCLGDGYCTWIDIADTMAEETGITERFRRVRDEDWSFLGKGED